MIEVGNTAQFINNQNAVLNSVEESLEKTSLARQSLNDGLQTFFVETTDAPENFVEETGFGSGHYQNHFRRRRYQNVTSVVTAVNAKAKA